MLSELIVSFVISQGESSSGKRLKSNYKRVTVYMRMLQIQEYSQDQQWNICGPKQDSVGKSYSFHQNKDATAMGQSSSRQVLITSGQFHTCFPFITVCLNKINS